MLAYRLFFFMGCCLLANLALADTQSEVAKASQNPMGKNPEASYLTFPMVNNVNFRYGAPNNTQDILQFKPIIPFQMKSGIDLILRPIFPLYHQPNLGTGNGYINGWGDFNPTVFISPTNMKNFWVWGLGPDLFIPTASNKALGSGKWSLGPQVALFYMPDPWVLGFLTSNVWSFAGDSKRQAVDQFSFQYFVSYNFKQGWFLTSQPVITANWKLPNNKWVIPFGLGGGRSFHLFGQQATFSLESYYNAIAAAQPSSKWTIQAKLEFLYLDH